MQMMLYEGKALYRDIGKVSALEYNFLLIGCVQNLRMKQEIRYILFKTYENVCRIYYIGIRQKKG